MKEIKVIDILHKIKERNKGNDIDVASFVDYGEANYMCDVIAEIADSNVDLYQYELLEWAKDNFCYIDYAMQEYGKPDDFLQYIRQGQYYAYSTEINENINDFMLVYAYNYLLREKNIETITEEQQEEIEENISLIDNDSRLSQIVYCVDEAIEKEEE